MKFTKLRTGVNATWEAVTNKGTYYINKSTSQNLGIVNYNVTVYLNDGDMKYLADSIQYLKEAKSVAMAFQNN